MLGKIFILAVRLLYILGHHRHFIEPIVAYPQVIVGSADADGIGTIDAGIAYILQKPTGKTRWLAIINV